MEDRVENWKKFAEHMTAYIRDRTVENYGVKNSDEVAGFDLMSITRNPLIMNDSLTITNILVM